MHRRIDISERWAKTSVVYRLFDALAKAGGNEAACCKAAGYTKDLLRKWRCGIKTPSALIAADEILATLGLELVVRKKRERKPKSVPAALTKQPKQFPPITIVVDAYVGGATIASIAKEHDVSFGWVRERLLMADVPMRKPGGRGHETGKYRERREEIARLWDKGYSIRAIARELDCFTQSVRHHLHVLAVERGSYDPHLTKYPLRTCAAQAMCDEGAPTARAHSHEPHEGHIVPA